MGIIIRPMTPFEFERHLPDLARLRIEVFQDFPYLYDGSFEYEVKYLQPYLKSKSASLIAAFDEDVIIGASTCLPLVDADLGLQNAFKNSGLNPEKIFYFGESVLKKHYRGQGIGKLFFAEREKWARSFGSKFNITAFCAVDRPAKHTLRPFGYRPLDSFWISQGYKKYDDLQAEFEWKDVDSELPTRKKMIFWLKKWG